MSSWKRPAGAGGSDAKRPRVQDEDDDFGDEMDDLLEDEEEIMMEVAAGQEPPEEVIAACLGSHDVAKMAAEWKRPRLPDQDPMTDAISFNQVETDYTVAPIPPSLARGSEEDRAAVIRMFGVTAEGHSVVAHVHGFKPYFYVRAPTGFKQEQVKPFHEMLNAKFRAALPAKDQVKNPIVNVGMVQRQSIMHYSFKQPGAFLRIVTALPSQVAGCRRLLENGMALPGGGSASFETFESNCAYALRFMVDRDIVGCNWITVPAGKWRPRPWDSTGPAGTKSLDKVTHCQLEFDCWFSDVEAHSCDEPEWMGIGPMRILSFDIECAGRPGVFPEADKDPVIQIANHVTRQGDKHPIIKNVFTLKECAPISGSQVLSFETEAEMLKAWHQFLLDTDPDVLTGYNIVNFDLPYLLNRAEALKIKSFPFLGRVKNLVSRMKDKMFQSKQAGTRESKEINIEGRVQFDMLAVLQRDYKLASYSLNSVCAHFLGEQKEDVHHSIISDLQAGNPETRRRLAVYCLKDAYLPQRLLQKLMCMINYVEMARVTGVPLSYLLTRGQQIKVMSQLYRKAKTLGLLLPVQARKNAEGDKYEGATVIDPIKGFYKDPIATLDFASLYPSIMMAHNLCYSTLLRRQDISRLPPDAYARSPTGDCFVKTETHKGILPQILEELLAARKNAKKLMKQEKDPFKYAVYDGRQLALKVSANSVYGFTGAQVGQLPCLEISSSVTGYGRQMIESTKQQVEAHYCTAKGYEFDSQVIYGDTDSVMIKFGTDSLAEAMRLGEEAAGIVTESFIKPIKLEFEKCYHPYLLMNKKRYAGLLWTNTEKHDKMDCKGIETVRRDNCQLVKDVVDTSLRAILIQKDPEMAVNFVKGQISQLLMNEMDMSKLVISKQLTKTNDQYAAGVKLAHVELASRIKKRDPGLAPSVGDRIPYVMIKGIAGAKAYEKAEDPIYVLDNNLPLDTEWYLEHQLAEPIKRLFEPIVENTKSLLEGDHTRRIRKAMPTTGGLMKFVAVTQRCLGCKASLPGGKDAASAAVCMSCKPRETEIYYSKLRNLAECERLFWQTAVACQRITGDNFKDVLGIARDSPIYYQMKKAQKDLNEATETVARFGAPGTW
jgi:DNA polymerase delta subunit 1